MALKITWIEACKMRTWTLVAFHLSLLGKILFVNSARVFFYVWKCNSNNKYSNFPKLNIQHYNTQHSIIQQKMNAFDF